MWWRLRRQIWCRARPGSRSAPGCGAPSARTGLTRVVDDLHAAANGQSFGHNLQAAVVQHRRVEVEVAQVRLCAACACRSPSVSGCARVGEPGCLGGPSCGARARWRVRAAPPGAHGCQDLPRSWSPRCRDAELGGGWGGQRRSTRHGCLLGKGTTRERQDQGAPSTTSPGRACSPACVARAPRSAAAIRAAVLWPGLAVLVVRQRWHGACRRTRRSRGTGG